KTWPLGLFQGIDFNDSKGTPVRAATSPKPGRTGWNVMPGLGHTGHGMTTDEYLAAEMYRRESMEFAKNYMQKRYGRKQIVKVQKITHDWIWTCRICDHFFMSTKWSIIIKTANHHARQHETKSPCTSTSSRENTAPHKSAKSATTSGTGNADNTNIYTSPPTGQPPTKQPPTTHTTTTRSGK